ncbi:MAG: 4-(cytidine 5'-diphospho)-2-C-methyl-D-erythritol kinase [Candidatus Wallbacteria bacterium]|nr:4-(cytidine 5'-diphospho)-2-C-methyl-D-erythritol kinase [Candidatus Wallbacteria bacterium]
MWKFKAPAKINLFLDVIRRRDDGYHELATLMQKVSLFDELEYEEAPVFSISSSDPDLDREADGNLVTRMYRLLLECGVKLPGLKVRLRKNIPIGAGMGGGSSDAGTFLMSLEKELGIRIPGPARQWICRETGADVSFFAGPATSAWATGIGDQIEPVEITGRFPLLILKPYFPLSTAEVYHALTCGPVPESQVVALVEALNSEDWNGISLNLYNELEQAAESVRPEIRKYRALVSRMCLGPVMMSGSGSAFFGFRPKEIYFSPCQDYALYRVNFL